MIKNNKLDLHRERSSLCHLWNLWFSREPGSNQGFKAAQYRLDFFEPIFYHDERRTGARVFSWSGTVGDVPSVFV